MMNTAFAYGDSAVDPVTPEITWVMGGSGDPIPSEEYVAAVNKLYFPDIRPTNPYPENALFTPEGLYPLTGVKSLPLDTSVAQGVTILNNTINPNGVLTPEATLVFGYSQSTIIASLEMEALDPNGTPQPDSPLSFAMIGDVMNPNGGLFERFDGLQIASLGLDFSGATPADDYLNSIYTLEYDGYADFPRYPIDLLSDLNAFAGIYYVHGTYPDLTSTQVESALLLPGSMDYGSGTADSLTNYYMITVNDLPLLDPIRSIPFFGNAVADLLQPDLTYLVNLGYGDPLYGWSTSPANIPTPFGLFPSLSAFEQLPGLLVSGTEEGIHNFIADLTGSGPNPVTFSLGSLLDSASGTSSALAGPLTALSTLASDPGSLVTDIVNVVNTLSGAASTAYATLLPTADLANALLTSMPAYDVSLFLNNLSDPVNAIGLPIAADMALVTLAGGFEFDVLLDAATSIAGDLGSLIP
ncbi:PE-PPE domain-containing protein [Mycobacterium botniense]|nr:PE-PPE domain-containing protein [Mycobacterium botniense]